MGPEAALEHLVGLQAQNPPSPYHALHARLADFDPLELSGLLERREAVRMVLMRGTIHLVTADDAARLRPVVQPVLDRELFGNRTWGAGGRGRGPRPGAGVRAGAGGGAAAVPGGASEPVRHALAGPGRRDPRLRDPQPPADDPGDPPGPVGPHRCRRAHHAGPLDRPADGRGRDDRRGDRPLPARLRAGDGGRRSGVVSPHRPARGLRAAAPRPAHVPRRAWPRAVRRPGRPVLAGDEPAPVRLLPDYDNALLAHADRSRIVPRARLAQPRRQRDRADVPRRRVRGRDLEAGRQGPRRRHRAAGDEPASPRRIVARWRPRRPRCSRCWSRTRTRRDRWRGPRDALRSIERLAQAMPESRIGTRSARGRDDQPSPPRTPPPRSGGLDPDVSLRTPRARSPPRRSPRRSARARRRRPRTP